MVRLDRKDYQAIVSYCKEGKPEECCGLLGGIREENGDCRVKKVYYLTNTDHSPVHFSMDVKQQLAAIKDMRSLGITLIGNFHSHPGTPARPSEEDKRLAFDPKLRYMILSLMMAEPVLKAFRITGEEGSKTSKAELIEIIDKGA